MKKTKQNKTKKTQNSRASLALPNKIFRREIYKFKEKWIDWIQYRSIIVFNHPLYEAKKNKKKKNKNNKQTTTTTTTTKKQKQTSQFILGPNSVSEE